jgi:hypothetical protein
VAKDSNFTSLKFNDWYQLGQEIKAIDGIEAVVLLRGTLFKIMKRKRSLMFVHYFRQSKKSGRTR